MDFGFGGLAQFLEISRGCGITDTGDDDVIRVG